MDRIGDISTLMSVVFDLDNGRKSALIEAIALSDSFYLLEILRGAREILSEDNGRAVAKVDFYNRLDLEICKRIPDLIE